MQEQKTGFLKSLRILHLALLAGQCMFLAVIVFVATRAATPALNQQTDKILQVIALLVSFAAVFGSMRLFKKKLLAINDTAANITDKTSQYRTANILQWAMLEGACLFSVICFFLTGNYSFAALAIAIIAFFAMLIPSKIKMMLQLRLSDQEADELE